MALSIARIRGLAAAALLTTLSTGVASAATTPLKLINGWTNKPFSTRWAGVDMVDNIVYLRGAIATAGTNSEPFVLPPKFRPQTNVYVAVDMCNASKGRLDIEPNGTVFVEAETAFSNAQCFTSLEGVSFAKNSVGFTSLPVTNGWTGGPFSTSPASARVIDTIVHLKGAISTTGTSTNPFKLPVAFRPIRTVYVPVDMCNATNGRLFIQPTGVVSVQAETSFSNAQCFTALDGVSFARGSSGFTTLPLTNSWQNSPFSTRPAAIRMVGDAIQFEGAISTSGTNATAFVLPVGFHPENVTYIPVDLCNAANGRLIIQKDGTASIQAEKQFSDAQCFTSLEGAWFLR